MLVAGSGKLSSSEMPVAEILVLAGFLLIYLLEEVRVCPVSPVSSLLSLDGSPAPGEGQPDSGGWQTRPQSRGHEDARGGGSAGRQQGIPRGLGSLHSRLLRGDCSWSGQEHIRGREQENYHLISCILTRFGSFFWRLLHINGSSLEHWGSTGQDQL